MSGGVQSELSPPVPTSRSSARSTPGPVLSSDAQQAARTWELLHIAYKHPSKQLQMSYVSSMQELGSLCQKTISVLRLPAMQSRV